MAVGGVAHADHRRSAARDECDDDLSGVTVEVLPAPVVDRGRARVGVACRDLHVTERDTGVERDHDERRPQHVRVHGTETGALADRPDPAARGASVEALAVASGSDLVVFAQRGDQAPHQPVDLVRHRAGGV